jgi:hypothetical protein
VSDAAAELPIDDPGSYARAVERASAGQVTRLVRDGHPVAEMVPTRQTRREQSDQVVTALCEMAGAAAPSGADYARAFAMLGVPFPGDEQLRQDGYAVADPS